jgi:PAS domain S-box-containing protein
LAVDSENNVDRMMKSVARLVAEILGDGCSITILNAQKERYHVAALYDTDPVALSLLQDLLKAAADFPRDQGMTAMVIRSGKPVLLPAPSLEEVKAVAIPSLTEYVDRVGVASSLIVPIPSRSGMIGTLSLSRHRGGKPYTASDQSFLTEIAHLVGVEVEYFTSIDSLRKEVAGRQYAKEALAASEERFISIFQSTTLGIQVMDLVGTILESNHALQTMTGYSEEDLIGLGFDELVHPDDVAQVARVFTDMKTSREPHARIEHRMVRKDGSIIWVRATFAGVKKGAGDDTLALIVGIKEDITELKAAEAALVHSERTLVEAQRLARLGSLEFDPLTQTLYASEEALRIFGIPGAEYHGSDTVLIDRMHPDDRQRVIDITRKVLQGQIPQEFEFRVVHPDGQVRIVHDRIAPYRGPDGQPTRLLGTVRDVTEKRQAEAELAELKRHLQRNIELERLRLAQELHDVPLQQLYTVIYKLEEMRHTAGAAQAAVLGSLSGEVKKAVDDLRTTATELRPPTLSKFGLGKAIRSYLEDFQQKHPDIRLKHSLAQDRQYLPEEVRLALYRVFQGAMMNTMRHSQATEVQVNFSFDAEEACIEIIDNGQGFNVPSNWMKLVRQGHYGLAGMAERVSAAGGVLTVESQPGAQTRIRVVIPSSSGT